VTSSNPIGRLPDEHNHQAARDAAAGPPTGGKSRSDSDWPPPYKPSTQHRGGGGYHPNGIHFRCHDPGCGWIADSIVELIQHTLLIHGRQPVDAERTPAK
jgi:hypothetical protein